MICQDVRVHESHYAGRAIIIFRYQTVQFALDLTLFYLQPKLIENRMRM